MPRFSSVMFESAAETLLRPRDHGVKPYPSPLLCRFSLRNARLGGAVLALAFPSERITSSHSAEQHDLSAESVCSG